VALHTIKEFLRLEAAAGIILVIAAAVAMVWANSPAAGLYADILGAPVVVQVGALKIAKPLLLWINDGLMALFFLLVALEIKREVLEGELSSIEQAALPGIAAGGGMLAPAAVYLALTAGNQELSRGWAIPTATDIAFAVGVLALLGNRAPGSLKIFLLALAIIDDLGAIVIIAVFYTHDLSTLSLALAAIGIAGLVALNLAGVARLMPYMLVGLFLWVCVLKSGVHATLAGVAIGMAIPLKGRGDEEAPLHTLEHTLHPWVTYAILPLFAFTNAGVPLAGLSPSALLAPLPLGIAAGLFLGKQFGVFAATWIVIRLGLAKLPQGANWLQIYGLALLTGIGFTMSLFIGTLAFHTAEENTAVRIGVLAGSLLSAFAGYAVLHWAGRNPRAVPRDQ
jgi:NhaA family Na+:H+ antiporter